jgi:hypothetical protein
MMKRFRGELIEWLAVVLLLAGSGLYVFSRPVRASETQVIAQVLQTAASASNATHTPIGPGLMARCRESAVYIDWGTGVTSGAIKVETAVDANYTGTWAPLATVTFAGTAPNQDVVQITGVHWAVRTRISTVLAGGTVNTWLVCN